MLHKKYKRTFIIEPDGNLLVHVVKHGDGDCKQYLWQICAEIRHRARFDMHVDPALQLQNAPQTGKYSTQTNADHRNADKVTEQVAFPCWIKWLVPTSH